MKKENYSNITIAILKDNTGNVDLQTIKAKNKLDFYKQVKNISWKLVSVSHKWFR